HIDLDPADWAIATWRPREALPVTATTFDLPSCLARLRRLDPPKSYQPVWDWTPARLTSGMSPEEGHFWFVAMTSTSREVTPRTLAHALEWQRFTGAVPRQELLARLRERAGLVSAAVVVPLAALLPPEELIDLLLDEELFPPPSGPLRHLSYTLSNLQLALADGLAQHVRPRLDSDDLES